MSYLSTVLENIAKFFRGYFFGAPAMCIRSFFKSLLTAIFHGLPAF